MDKETFYLFRKHLDPVTFLESFVSVDTPKGLVPWDMDNYQKNLVRDFSRQRAINKSKKTGISTTLAGQALHISYTSPGQQLAMVSTGQRIAGEMLGKYFDELDSMPSALQVIPTSRTAEKVEFPNKVRIFSLPSGDPDKIRGLGLRGKSTDVILDEFSFAPNDKQLWLVVRDFQRYGGKVTVNSTPKGKRGKYYEICAPLQTVHRGLAKYNPTDWSYHEIPYTRCKRLLVQEKSLKEDIDEIEFQEEYCVVEGTKIVTETGLKKIEDIKTGEKVLTHDGTFNNVTKVFERFVNENVIKIKTWYDSEHIILTKKHKMLSVKRPKTSRFYKKQKENICNNNLEWISSNDLEKHDFLIFPKTKYETKNLQNFKLTDFIGEKFLHWNDKKLGDLIYTKPYNYKEKQKYRYNKFPKKFVKNNIKVDKDLMILIGYYLSEGCCHDGGVMFSFNSNETEYHKEVIDALKNVFGVEAKIIKNKVFNALSIYVNRKAIGLFFKQFGTNCYTKKIPKWVLNLPIEKTKFLIRALFNGDGCYFKEGLVVGYCSVSEELRFQVRELLLKYNIISSFCGDKKSMGVFTAKDFYEKILDKHYTIEKCDRGIKGWVTDKYLFLPIKTKEEIPYKGKVYNLTVEKNNSYVCKSFTVHNCCEFIDESTSFFPFDMIWKAQRVEKYIDDGGDKPIYFGIDFGKSIGETVVIIVEEYDTEKYRVIWIEPMSGIDYPSQIELIKQLSTTYNPVYINIDASGPGGQTIYDFLQKDDQLCSKVWGFNFDFTFKEKIIIRTRMLMSRDRLLLPTKSLPWAETLEKQLHQMKRTTSEHSERTKYSGKTEGKNDDYVWALALSVWKEIIATTKEAYFEEIKDEALKKIETGFKTDFLDVFIYE